MTKKSLARPLLDAFYWRRLRLPPPKRHRVKNPTQSRSSRQQPSRSSQNTSKKPPRPANRGLQSRRQRKNGRDYKENGSPQRRNAKARKTQQMAPANASQMGDGGCRRGARSANGRHGLGPRRANAARRSSVLPGAFGAMGNWGPQASMQRPMNRWGQQPGGFGAMQEQRQDRDTTCLRTGTDQAAMNDNRESHPPTGAGKL